MSRSKPGESAPHPKATTGKRDAPGIPPSKTSHLFGPRKPGDRGANVTSERIADDLAAFQRAGGRIEVLGITRTLTRIEPEAKTAAIAPARKGRR